ncbi:DUF6438 domain-containing protein [Lysobacter antibioticus]|uniref:DUF6438 domain-containing protein n=1 Tax=Lysobacter antibioticus TaxID=84531 RepID=A0A0S2FAR4_LYSAN|nr:DUF6438 domain-containing protein [Lysobacter antibioticus]ALN80617.1 hypothetical protein LA76x_2487 [Lysobacter antibioticus]
MRWIVLPSLLLAVAACKPARPPVSGIDRTTVEIERSGCLDSCPTYKLRINSDGVAIFSARDFTGRHPLRSASGDLAIPYELSAQDRRALFARVNSKAFAELQPEYSAGVSDGPTTTITVSTPSGERRVVQNAVACLRDRKKPGALSSTSIDKRARFVPDVFCETVDLIETASCAGYWSAETRPPQDPNDPRLSPPPRCRLPSFGRAPNAGASPP